MIPRLAPRGVLIAAAALLFFFVGALHGTPALVAMGGVVISVLLAGYLAFFPTAILLRRKKIELSWWVPPGDQPGGALAVDRPFAIHLAFRNHGSRTLRILRTRVLAGSSLDISEQPNATVRSGRQVEVKAPVRALTAGYHVFHGAALVLGDSLGLFDVEAYFPNPMAVKVFPRQIPARLAALRPVGTANHDQVGLHQIRRRGHAGDLRELREHAHGDPFKFIAWKATAKRGKLMVRDLETELVATHQVLVDIGASMRSGERGKTPLDWAIDATSALARSWALSGDRVGAVLYDARPYGEIAANTGHQHWRRLVDRLLDAHSVIDEDLTDITPGELAALVARYLAHQEAIDVRVKHAPALDDPAWAGIQAGPDGQLYDLAAAGRMVGKLLDVMSRDKKGLTPPWWWPRDGKQGRDARDAKHVHHERAGQTADAADPQLLPLRRFCRLRGIELPYRQSVEHGRRAAGLAAAIETALVVGRPDSMVIISDLAGVLDDEATTIRALQRARKACGQVIAWVPTAGSFLPASESEIGDRVRHIVTADAAIAAAETQRLLARYGVQVISAQPQHAIAKVTRGSAPPRRAA